MLKLFSIYTISNQNSVLYAEYKDLDDVLSVTIYIQSLEYDPFMC